MKTLQPAAVPSVEQIAKKAYALSKRHNVSFNSDFIWLNPPICTMVDLLARRRLGYTVDQEIGDDDEKFYAMCTQINEEAVIKKIVRSAFWRFGRDWEELS